MEINKFTPQELECILGDIKHILKEDSHLDAETRQSIIDKIESHTKDPADLAGTNKTELREVIFRARRKDNGQWEYGNYHHNIRKGKWHGITNKDSNETVEVYRESLQIMGWGGEWENV